MLARCYMLWLWVVQFVVRCILVHAVSALLPIATPLAPLTLLHLYHMHAPHTLLLPHR